ncbi:MAG TPA: response regulator [Dehalococcoidia bacterium]|nr:response regulator [Dehalococcoidia bacterium]
MTAVLLVEDEPAIMRMLALILEDMGYDVYQARNAERAIDLLKEVPTDLVLADVRLPGMSGVELAKRIREQERFSDIAIVLMSAYGEPRQHNADGFIEKPFYIDDFIERLNPYLTRD